MSMAQVSKMFLNASLKGVTLDVGEQELALINQFTMKTLTAEDVFVFKLAMCDNEIDRDIEQFSDECLTKLAELFKGRTVISDHYATSKNQSARIYDTEVETTSDKNSLGQPYKRLIAKCYMPVTKSNEDLILEINAGIKKEVSVGVSIGKVQCSICGIDRRKQTCDHKLGAEYNKKKCHFILCEPTDAYEVSFVAVPAQKQAGVIKSYELNDQDVSKQLEIEKAKTEILSKM
ncbi:hypothetical protein RBG61_01995 [Paludicola sp. MB14-C6]|uniref:hypothetical protein n=1 Tax=Paludihabitans sp. MB14-C6 TaxID=3070656 RepID=UPI0027DAB913|nr:hypothetical protein [Paludicola sp. MB14-C6]WMJ23463.1 hypothetical protein RBG61_01995 [Paludicola sp. MB14-C6]